MRILTAVGKWLSQGMQERRKEDAIGPEVIVRVSAGCLDGRLSGRASPRGGDIAGLISAKSAGPLPTGVLLVGCLSALGRTVLAKATPRRTAQGQASQNQVAQRWAAQSRHARRRLAWGQAARRGTAQKWAAENQAAQRQAVR